MFMIPPRTLFHLMKKKHAMRYPLESTFLSFLLKLLVSDYLLFAFFFMEALTKDDI